MLSPQPGLGRRRNFALSPLQGRSAAAGGSELGSEALVAGDPSEPVDADAIARLVLTSLDDDKAEEILAIDVRGRSSVADVMIVASGRSQRHVGALADHLTRRLKEIGVRRVRVEGLPHCDWVLVDAGDVIVHLFRPEVRAFYQIERIWTPPGATV